MENNKAIKILSIAVGALLVLTLWNTIRIESLRSSLKEPAKAELPVKEEPKRTETKTKKDKSKSKFNVEVSTRVEDHYLQDAAVTPTLKEGEVGAVVVAITVNKAGKVTKATIDNGTTVTNDKILHACKEAALKTRFSSNEESSNKTKGTITYKITKK